MIRAIQAFCYASIIWMLSSCSSEQTVTKSQVVKDPWGKPQNYSIGKDENGNPVMKSDRRSTFEGKQSSIAGHRDFRGKDYTSKSYRKKRWGGNTLFGGNKKYSGNTDANKYRNQPWFVQQQSRALAQRSRAEGKGYRKLGLFRTTQAREQSGRRLSRPQDAETNVRRRVYKQPGITHWKEQKGLSVGDTNRMLGR